MYEKPVGDVRLYKRVLKHCNGNEQLADMFMLSSSGGYTDAQIRRIKTFIIYERKRYQKKLIAYDPL
jgi:hypothetical protein